MTDNPVRGWDVETDPMNPQPIIYPVCSGCGEAYEYRRALSLSRGGYIWAWFKPRPIPKGCRHKEQMVKNTEYAEP
jgi:hypothetical protein